MHYQDLIEFIDELEKQGELKRITLPGETQRKWGKTIIMDGDVINKIKTLIGNADIGIQVTDNQKTILTSLRSLGTRSKR